MKKITAIILCVFLFSACVTISSTKKSGSAVKTDAKQDVLRFKSVVLSKYWSLVGIQTDSVFVDIMPEHGNSGVIRFYENGNLETSSGLNTSLGRWKYLKKSGEFYRFEVSGIKPTNKIGENSKATKFDRSFFSALKRTKYLSVAQNIITLLDENKKPLLKFFAD
ncbi:MAG: hypothetical protein CR988_02120 [Treponema sp.]|nr:MAG: hypothetical protein CR988_02120 [Treponema sp.]